jgi:hypothetical protein
VKRAALAALVFLALAGCASHEERPEGIVERWLLALNRGSAGEPGRYAPASVSDAILPDWRDLDPGELDVIEVGSGDRIMDVCDEGSIVPFRVVPLDGDEVRDAACVDTSRIVRLADLSDLPMRVFPSGGGPPVTEDRASPWLIAVGVGLVILLVSEALMRLVRVRHGG